MRERILRQQIHNLGQHFVQGVGRCHPAANLVKKSNGRIFHSRKNLIHESHRSGAAAHGQTQRIVLSKQFWRWNKPLW